MRSPLAVIKLRHKGRFIWRITFSAATVRGTHPVTVVYLREPIDEERAIVEQGLNQKDQVFLLDELLQWKAFGLAPEPLARD